MNVQERICYVFIVFWWSKGFELALIVFFLVSVPSSSNGYILGKGFSISSMYFITHSAHVSKITQIRGATGEQHKSGNREETLLICQRSRFFACKDGALLETV